MCVRYASTRWRRGIGCIVFIYLFPQQSPIVRWSFTEWNLQQGIRFIYATQDIARDESTLCPQKSPVCVRKRARVSAKYPHVPSYLLRCACGVFGFCTCNCYPSWIYPRTHTYAWRDGCNASVDLDLNVCVFVRVWIFPSHLISILMCVGECACESEWESVSASYLISILSQMMRRRGFVNMYSCGSISIV